MIELELPFPPSVNHYYRRAGKRMLISREGRAYREKVCAILAGLKITPLEGDLQVQVDLYPPDRRRRDIDNLQKALWDSLQHGGVYKNDFQIRRLEIERHDPTPGGKALVSIKPWHSN